mgnify:CR=1 FL=1
MPFPQQRRRHRLIWLVSSIGLYIVGAVVGAALQNVWLGLLLATIVSLVWLIAVESRKGGNVGLDDPDRGVEL